MRQRACRTEYAGTESFIIYCGQLGQTVGAGGFTNRSTRLLSEATLRNILGTKTLAEILSDREHVAQNMQVQKG